MALFGKARKKAKADAKARKNEKGAPRSESERKKVNKRLKKKYGYSEHFKPARVEKGGMGSSAAKGDNAAEIMKMSDKNKRKGK